MDTLPSDFGPRSPRWLASPWTVPLLVFFVSLGLTLWAWRIAVRSSAEIGRANFLRQRDTVVDRLHDRLLDCEYVLMGGAGLFVANDHVSRDDWRKYVETLRPEEKLGGVQGVGFAERVLARDLPAHLARVRAEGYPDYAVHPEGPREEYTSIIYLEPFRDRNLRAFGYDMTTEPVRRAAMERARDEGRAAMSGRVVLVQEVPGQPMQHGFLIYVPVYAHGQPHQTVDERRASLTGYVYSPFRAGDFVNRALYLEPSGLAVEIYDGDRIAPESLLYATGTGPGAEMSPAGYRPAYCESIPVVLLGRTWTLRFSSLPSFDSTQRSARAPLTLVVGLFCGLLGTGLTAVLAARNRALQQVARMSIALREAHAGLEQRVRDRTTELSQANARLEQDIVARRRTEKELASISAHYHQLLSVASDGIHVLDADGRLIEWSDSFRRMLGYQPDQMPGLKVMDWDAHFTVEELGRRIRDLIAHPAVFETRHRRQDGTVFDVEINASGVVLEGRSYLYCSSRDITERKQAEAAMRRAAEEIQDLYNRAPCGYHSLNPEGVIVQINDTELEWLGLSRDEVIGKRRMSEFVAPGSLERFRAGLAGFVATGVVHDLDLELVRRDGTVFNVLVNATAVRDDQGKVAFSRSTLFDITERKQAEAAQHASEHRFRLLVENSPFCIHEIDLEGRLQSMNRAGLEMMHLDDERKVCGVAYLSAVGKEDAPRIQSLLRRAIAGEPSHFEFLSSGESPRYFKSCFIPIRGADGKVARLMGITEDISAGKEAQDRLRLQGTAMEAAASTIMITGVDGTIQWVNPAFTKASGYTLAEAVGRNPSLVKSGVHSREFYATMWATILRGDVWRGEIRNKRKDGSVYDEELTITPVRDVQGRITHFVAIKSDISARKRVEETRQAAAAYARSLIEASLDPLVTINILGMITDVNEASVQITGVPREKLIGTDFSNYFTEPAKAREGYRRVFAEGSVHDYPLALRHVSGRVTDVLYNASVYRDPHGNVLGVFAAARDVTERNRLLEQTTADARAKSDLLREVNHRVANNLTSILGLIVGEAGMVDSRQRATVKPVLDRLSQRIRGLLDAHRMLSDLKWAPVRIRLLAEQIIRAAIGADTERRDANLRIGACEVVVSPRQASNLALILNELATNSVKYAGHGPEPLVILLDCATDQEFITLRYADNGPGFPPEVLAGQRANIGLQLVRQLVTETLRGELTLANRPGAEVTLRFRVEEGHRT